MTLSFVLGILGVTGQMLSSRRPVAGWTLSLLAQPLWSLFAIMNGQYGLLLMGFGYSWAAIRHLRKAGVQFAPAAAARRVGEVARVVFQVALCRSWAVRR